MVARKVLIGFSLIFFLTPLLHAQKLKLEDVISKHLNAIGSAEKRKELTNMVLLGSSVFESKLPKRHSMGKLAIVSDASNFMFLSSFEGENYPFEKIGVFDGKINVPFVSAGIRSPLGDFLWEHPTILDSGLFSGSTSLHWSLLEKNLDKETLKLSGTKKIDGRKCYVLDYATAGTSDGLKFRLYFDMETFQHVRSEYREEFFGKDPAFGTLGQTNGYIVELSESFREFKTYDGVTLPSVLKIHYGGSSAKGTYEYDWIFNITEAQFNKSLKEDFFRF